MWNYRTSRQGQTRSGNARRWLALCVLAGALLPDSGAAQSPTVIEAKAGLQTMFERHVLLATVTETGSRSAVSEVTIEFRDAADQQRAFAVTTLTTFHAAQLRFTIPAGSGRLALRPIVRIRQLTTGFVSEPIIGLEDLDTNALTVVPKVVCSIGPSVPGGAEAHCDGFHVNRLTLEQANSPD